jgi:ankyrin repeat protein
MLFINEYNIPNLLFFLNQIGAGASLDIVDLTGKSAIIHAVCRSGKEALFFLELLIASGADLNVRDTVHGWTALHWAMHKVAWSRASVSRTLSRI